MQLLHCSPKPNADFASLSVLLNNNIKGFSDDDENSPALTSFKPYGEIITVVSPLATTSATAANHALMELHQYLVSLHNHKKHGKDNISGAKKKKRGKEQNNASDELHDDDGDDEGGENQSKAITGNASIANDPGGGESSARDENDNNKSITQPQHGETATQLEGEAEGLADKHSKADSLRKLRSSFHSKCLDEEVAYHHPLNSTNRQNILQMYRPRRSRSGFALQYVYINDPETILRCTASTIFSSKKPIPNSSSSLSPAVLGIVLAVGITGMQQSYHCYPTSFTTSLLPNRILECATLLQELPPLFGNTSKSTFNSNSNNSNSNNKERTNHLRNILTSIVLEDDDLKTNSIVEVENGTAIYNGSGTNTSILLDGVLTKITHNSHNNTNSNSANISKSTKFLLSSGMGVTKIPKRLKKRYKHHRSKHHSSAYADNSSANTFSNPTTTELISSSAAVPSSDIARIVSEQMQVLSLVERSGDMVLRRFEARTRMQKARNSNVGAGGSSGGGTGIRNGGFSKSPTRPGHTRRMSKLDGGNIGTGGKYDLNGFDYVPPSTLPYSQSAAHVKSSGSVSIAGGSYDGANMAIGGAGQSLVSVGSDLSSSNGGLGGGGFIVSSVPSWDSNMTATTTGTGTTHGSTVTGSSTSSSSSSVTSTSAIPLLSGSVRDSSALKRQMRRNRVLAASVAAAAENRQQREGSNAGGLSQNARTSGDGNKAMPLLRSPVRTHLQQRRAKGVAGSKGGTAETALFGAFPDNVKGEDTSIITRSEATPETQNGYNESGNNMWGGGISKFELANQKPSSTTSSTSKHETSSNFDPFSINENQNDFIPQLPQSHKVQNQNNNQKENQHHNKNGISNGLATVNHLTHSLVGSHTGANNESYSNYAFDQPLFATKPFENAKPPPTDNLDASFNQESQKQQHDGIVANTRPVATVEAASPTILENDNPNHDTTHSLALVPAPTLTSTVIPETSNQESEGAPSQLLVNVALNEDLTCSYRNSKISSCLVEGVVQVQIKSDSTVYVPFILLVKDLSNHIRSLQENKKYANEMSPEIQTDNDAHGSDNSSIHKYVITVPKADHYFPVLRYKCVSLLRPVPLRVQTRVRVHGSHCRVALQISSNPANEKGLTDITIMMAVPPNVKGDTLTTQPMGGIWNEEKRNVLWCVAELGEGEKFQLQAQFELDGPFDDGDSDSFEAEEEKKKPSFPVLIRCQCMYAQLSKVQVEVNDIQKVFPSKVKMKLAKRFRLSHREKS